MGGGVQQGERGTCYSKFYTKHVSISTYVFMLFAMQPLKPSQEAERGAGRERKRKRGEGGTCYSKLHQACEHFNIYIIFVLFAMQPPKPPQEARAED